MAALLTLIRESFGYTRVGRNVSARGIPMRDLMFMLAPVALVLYFVVYPDQFSLFVGWAGSLLR
jgi:hypothetical protein